MKTFEWTRWRSVADPTDPTDLLQPDSPRFEAGKLPLNFPMMVTDGKRLAGPFWFTTKEEADKCLQDMPWITKHLILPKP